MIWENNCSLKQMQPLESIQITVQFMNEIRGYIVNIINCQFQNQLLKLKSKSVQQLTDWQWDLKLICKSLVHTLYIYNISKIQHRGRVRSFKWSPSRAFGKDYKGNNNNNLMEFISINWIIMADRLHTKNQKLFVICRKRLRLLEFFQNACWNNFYGILSVELQIIRWFVIIWLFLL